MLLHHALQPESEKGLAFLGSVYTNEASWKMMRQAGEDNHQAGRVIKVVLATMVATAVAVTVIVLWPVPERIVVPPPAPPLEEVRVIPLKKADRLPSEPEIAAPAPSSSVPVIVPPVPKPPVPDTQVVRHGRATSDICTAHGMHKVNYGRRWRCRK